MDKMPPDWVLLEAAKRSGFSNQNLEYLRRKYKSNLVYRALCGLILETQQPPVDRKKLCAEAAYNEWWDKTSDMDAVDACIRAIELWEEGFGQ